ncbi:MAG: 6-carboxytetrahydropterin synthase [Bacteroidia bacterium]|nr:6-carboxytetrahydropterin synthase [Bacteroidia bacterium]MDW8302923.1 6-carboxytetrahydropterin synthase [Bacteroidia bacterium]
MIYITRKVHFSATHKMWNNKWTPEQNKAYYGPCANENWHGHNYTLEVTLVGTVNPETGYVIDLKYLKNILETHIVSKVDHKNLTLDVDFMKDVIPSTENFAVKVWQILYPLLNFPNAKLYEIKMYETERNWVTYRGE